VARGARVRQGEYPNRIGWTVETGLKQTSHKSYHDKVTRWVGGGGVRGRYQRSTGVEWKKKKNVVGKGGKLANQGKKKREEVHKELSEL